MRKYWTKNKELSSMHEAASAGDLNALRATSNAGSNLFETDYDKRTALHLAAAEGHSIVVDFLIKHAPVEQRS
jgi:ankyrin repeat protein